LINPNKLKEKIQNTCSFPRRLAAIFYDSVILSLLFFIATSVLIPFLKGEIIDSNNFIYKIYLLLLAYLYFVWQWSVIGNTLGMRCWGIKIINKSSVPPNWQQATKRYFASMLSISLFGTGFLWGIIDRNKNTLHDHVSKTQLIVKK